MIVYVISFFFSLLFMRAAIISKKGVPVLIYHIMAVLPPVLLLTFRSIDCGTDTVNYMMIYDHIETEGFFAYVAGTRFEFLFASIMFGLKRMGLSIEYLFFISGILTILPVYLGCLQIRKFGVNPLLPMALFYLFFYQYSFNIVRQSIAMSFVFLSIVYLIQNKIRPSLLVMIIAILFHYVAVIVIIPFIIYITRFQRTRNRAMIFVISSVIIVYLLRYVYDAKAESVMAHLENSATLQMSYLVEMIINLLFVAIAWKKDKTGLKRFFLFVSCLTVITIVIGSQGAYMFRIANAIDILLLIYIPLALKHSKNRITIYSYMSFAVVFWWYIFIFRANGASYPYISSLDIVLF